MPAAGEEPGEAPGPAGGVQGHAGLPAVEVFGHDRLVDREQPAARVLVVAGGVLLVGGDGADLLGEHTTAAQLLVIEQPPDLGQPGFSECAVVISSPGVKQRDAFESEQIGQRVLVDHES